MDTAQLSGAELDRAIAERLMGWERMPGQTALAPFAYKRPDGHIVHPYSAPNYSGSIEAAMQVIEKMNADGWSVVMSNDDERAMKQWFVEFDKSTKTHLITGMGDRDSLAEAICIAALAAIEGS